MAVLQEAATQETSNSSRSHNRVSFTLDLELTPAASRLIKRELSLSGLARSVERPAGLLLLDGHVFGYDLDALADLVFEQGVACLKQLDGLFVLVWIDYAQSTVTIQRDPLGRRTAFYVRHHDRLRISNRTSAFSNHSKINPRRITDYLTFTDGRESETYFEKVHEAPAGASLVIGNSDTEVSRTWTPSIDDYQSLTVPEQYRVLDGLISQAVGKVFETIRPQHIGIMLSGGMDSSTLAAYVRQFTSLTAFSWTFDDPAMDESEELRATAKKLGIPLVEVPVSLNSARTLELPTPHRFTPDQHIFREIKRQIYQMAQDKGVDLLINGVWGDQLFRPLHRYQTSWRKRLRVWWNRRSQQSWINSPTRRNSVAAYSRYQRPHQALQLLGRAGAMNDAWESLLHTKESLNLVSPYRDCDLVSFALGVTELPPFQRYSKPHLRQLAAGKLPDLVTWRTRRTSLHPYFEQRLLGSQASMVQTIDAHRSLLRPWVTPDVVKAWCKHGPKPVHFLGFWMCHAMIKWMSQPGLDTSGVLDFET